MKLLFKTFFSVLIVLNTSLFANNLEISSFFNSQLALFILIILIVIFYFIKKERKLEKSYNQVESVINSTIEAIIVSQNYKCIDFNKAALELFKIEKKEDALGKNPLDFIAEESKELVQKKIQLDSAELYEAVVLKMDGTRVPVLLKGTNTPIQTITAIFTPKLCCHFL